MWSGTTFGMAWGSDRGGLPTRLVVVGLIERVNVFENAEIEVVFRQRDQFEDIIQFVDGHREVV